MHFTLVAAFALVGLATSASTGNSYQCPGALSAEGRNGEDGANNEYCCIGGQVSVSNCAGWPLCEGPTSFDPATQTLDCATTIPVTVSNYDDLVSSASSMYLNDAGSITATANGNDDKATKTADDEAAKTTDDSPSTATPTTVVSTTVVRDVSVTSAAVTSSTATGTATTTGADSTATDGADSDDKDGGAGMVAAALWPVCGALMACAAWY